jgi:hypothetical protein
MVAYGVAIHRFCVFLVGFLRPVFGEVQWAREKKRQPCLLQRLTCPMLIKRHIVWVLFCNM